VSMKAWRPIVATVGLDARLALTVGAGALARVLALSDAPDNNDAVFFVRGVERFSVIEARPHWPCYPAYIAVGKVFAWMFRDPVLGLQVLSALTIALVAWPLAWIVRSWAESLGAPPRDAARAGWLAALLWLVTPMSAVTGIQMISDSPGLLLGVAVLALCIAGEERRSRGQWIAAATLAALMVGVRLVNVTMLGPFLWKAWSARRERWGAVRPGVALSVGLFMGCAPWVLGLLLADSRGYSIAARAHVVGHFLRFGESALTDQHLIARPYVALRTTVLYGLGAGLPSLGWWRVVAAIGWATLLVCLAFVRPWRGPVFRLIALWAVPNLVYIFLGHDVAFPRYLLTATLVVAMSAGLAAGLSKRIGLVAAALTIGSGAAVSIPLAIHQRDQPPVEYLAARYLAQHAPGVVVILAAPDLVPLYLSEYGGGAAPVLASPGTFSYWRGRWRAEGRPVYSTFLPPGDAEGWVPVAHFCRDPMIEPGDLAELWLFQDRAPPSDAPTPQCGEAR